MTEAAASDAIVELVRAGTGLTLPNRDRPRTERALRGGARAEACRSLRAYEHLLRDDAGALSRLATRLTVGETYFFRDSAQMQLLRGLVLPDIAAARGSGMIRLWSAGCSSGEEAYSLAMIAAEAGLLAQVEVRGTDLSAEAITRARAARYGIWSLRGVDERRRQSFFESAGEAVTVRPDIRRRVRFTVANLLEEPPGRFDLVVCRNVLIYLTETAVARVAENLCASLRPEGWLVTGAADPPLEIPGLSRERTTHGLVYRRRISEPAPPPPAATRPLAHVLATDVAAGRARRPRPQPQGRARVAPLPPAPTDEVERLRILADTRPQDEVKRELARAINGSPTDPRLRYLTALLHLDWGCWPAAADHARAAIFLEPRLVAAHLVLGHAERQRGNPRAAARSYDAVAALLVEVPPDEEVWGADGRRAGDLAAVARQLRDRAVDGD